MALLAGCATTAVQAQDDTPDWKRWTVRYFNALDAHSDSNASGFADYLEERGFGDSVRGFLGGVTDYPLTNDGGGGGWSVIAAYAYRPQLKLGGSFFQGANVAALGFRTTAEGGGRPRIEQKAWAVAPIALWTPVSTLAVGAGPAFVRGTIRFSDGVFTLGQVGTQEDSFMRLGAVAFASLGSTLFRGMLYIGVQGQYLYVGTEEVGPYDLNGESIEAGSIRLDQFTFGPVVALNL